MKPELKSLYIYLTDECNLHCMHCWQDAPLAGKDNLSTLKFRECKDFLNTAISLGLRSVTFSGGEPLLNSYIFEFASFLKKNNICMAMETNGLLINENIEAIKNSNIYCCISLDGINADTHDMHRGLKGAFQKTIKGIEALEKENLYYQLIMVISRFNYQELIPLLNWVKDKWLYSRQFKINIVVKSGRANDMYKKGLLFEIDELLTISDEIGTVVKNYPFQILLHLDPAFFPFKNFSLNYFCGGHCGYNYSLSILANGEVSICSLGKQIKKYVFGHVSDVDLKDLWENNIILNEIHESTHLKLKGICSNCVFRKMCVGGCRANALLEYGDFFAPQPKCQQYYESGKFPPSRLIDPTRKIEYCTKRMKF